MPGLKTRLLRLSVKSLSGTAVAVESDPDDTVEDLKMKIHDLEGIPPDSQRLVFAGETLENGTSLCDYPIAQDSTLRLLYFASDKGPFSQQKSALEGSENHLASMTVQDKIQLKAADEQAPASTMWTCCRHKAADEQAPASKMWTSLSMRRSGQRNTPESPEDSSFFTGRMTWTGVIATVGFICVL